MKKINVKKTLLIALSYVLAISLAIGATIAYLTATDEDVNVMTMGNVDIAQLEYERVVDENGNWVSTGKTDAYGYTPDELREFSQAKPALPAVYQDGTTKWDDRNGSEAASGDGSYQQSWGEVGAPGSNQLFDDSVKNVVDKIVFVENTGKTDAYYRTVIAIECPEGVDASLIHTNVNGNTRFTWTDIGYAEVDGVQYFLKEALYNEILTPGEVSRPSLLQVFLDPATTNEDCAKFGITWDILVASQAVQADGFQNAATALDTAFGDITATSNPWLGANASQTVYSDVDALNEALANGEDVIAHNSSYNVLYSDDAIVLDAQGATATVMGIGDTEAYHGYIGWVADEVTVSNLNVTGSGFVGLGEYGNGGTKHVANNLVLTDMTSTLANKDKGITVAITFMSYAKETDLNNCVMTGAKAMVDGAEAFDIGLGQNLKTNINGGEYGRIYCWSHSVGVIDDAEVDYIQVAPIRGSLTIAEGTHVGTINVDYGTSARYATAANLAKIVIEEGATVDEIIFNGTTYTQAEWTAYVASLA